MTSAPVTASRRLLGRVRDVMAGGGTAQDRLDRVVKAIAQGMHADVCSCYVMRAGEVLELFATEGLKKSAVHSTRLRVSEGLVGVIAAHAETIALSDAWSHPNFAYRPETGEEPYQSLLGVPIIRGGRVIGVLVVQNRQEREYADEEIETLETVAMVLAELITGSDLIRPEELTPVDGNALLPLRLEGMRFNAGVGIGQAVLHKPNIKVRRLVSDDPETELQRLRDALAALHKDLDQMLAAADMAGGEHRDVLEAYQMFAKDAGWIGKISEHIRTGLTAEASVMKVHDDQHARLSQVSNPYLRERLHDLEDLANRLLLHLTDGEQAAARDDLPEHMVLICRSLGPAELLDYDRSKLRGLVLEEGSPSMHAAILARALDIPVVGRVKEVLGKVEPLDTVIVDGDHAQVLIRPGDDVHEAFFESMRLRHERRAAHAALKDQPAVTRDGVKVSLHINAGLLMDLQWLHETGAEGIGLYRTELPFMARSDLPDVAAQTVLYSRIIEQAQGKPVVFRTLDVGGDKLLPYWGGEKEDNPALGWRAIRITLDRPALLTHQLRALIRSAAGRELRVMFPMVAEVAEFDRAKAILDLELAREIGRGTLAPECVHVGTMLEVPALIWQLPALLARADFVSVGSNDLMQFLFANDRGNPRMAERYDPLSPAALKAFKHIADICAESGRAFSLCGEMAGRPLEAMALVALGYRTLSMSAPAVGAVKAMIRSMDLGRVRRYLLTQIDKGEPSLRHKLRLFALDHGITLS